MTQSAVATRVWSPYQAAVFDDVRSGAGHTVVRARAGSGKTTTVVEALRHVPRRASTIMVAFNKKIATELKTRAPSTAEVSTLHSYGLRAVTAAYGRLSGFDNDYIPGLIRERLPKAAPYKYALARLVSLAKMTLVRAPEDLDALIDDFDLQVEEFHRDRVIPDAVSLLEMCASEEDIRRRGCINFDDMIWLPTVNRLRTYEYERVFIDETQDLNAAQLKLALRACRGNGRICAVGDDRQSIYQFMGADEEAIPRVIRRLEAKVLPLSITYRCPRSVVRLAQEIVPDLEAAPGAEEGDVTRAADDEKYSRVIRDVRAGDFVLSRTNAPLIGICLALLRQGRAAHIEGRDIGKSLKMLVERMSEGDVTGLRANASEWCAKEMKRLMACDPPRIDAADLVKDKTAVIFALSEGAAGVDDVLRRIDRLFSDAAGDAARVVLSTTHKAKGLERDRVFLLGDTYRRRDTIEEDNLWYVTVTRAKKSLFIYSAPREDYEAHDA